MTDETERLASQAACDRLIARQNTLLLSTHSEAGNADISYAPYVREDATFYIFVSELAQHTKNLLAHPQASVLFIEAESESANLFARQRLTLDCQAREIHKTNPIYAHQLEAMTEKFGAVIDVLRGLTDFHLLALTPNHGRFVAGFGKTFEVDATGHIR